MSAFFAKSASERPQEAFPFTFYEPLIQTDCLVPGIDNIRFDVVLSSQFMEFCRGLLFQLIVKHSQAAGLLHSLPAPLKPADKKEFKEKLQDLLLTALNRANVEKNPQLEVLAQAALFQFLNAELQAQYALVIVQGREKLKLFESPHQQHSPRRFQLQEIFGNFQKNKKLIVQRASQELLDMVLEVCEGPVRKVRESFFGTAASDAPSVFSSPLVFTEDGKEDQLYLQQYVLLGNFQRDPDRSDLVEKELLAFLEWADSHSAEAQQYHSQQEATRQLEARLAELLQQKERQTSRKGLFSLGGGPASTPPPEELEKQVARLQGEVERHSESLRLVASSYEARLNKIMGTASNAELVVDYLRTEQQIAEARKQGAEADRITLMERTTELQREALDKLHEQLSRANIVPYILAAYETARIYEHFCPPLNPHQLKAALVERSERKKVLRLIQDYRLPEDSVGRVEEAARRVRDAGPAEIRTVLVRFLRDYFRCQQDICRFHLAQDLMGRVHLPTDPKQRELSEINHTLYRFLLSEEEKPVEEKIASHVILKADIRDSTSITEQLLARGLNPASYFSLNFFDPINKLLPRYGASKVFLEGDAVILAILEWEGDSRGANSVARACCLARDMIEGVRALNERASEKQLPLLEMGIGVCLQPSAPMYLMDGETRIMISKALNQSDRLSGCGKLARQVVGSKGRFFNVFVMQLLADAAVGGLSEEFLLHYNVHGVEINEAAFGKLCRELSMNKLELKLPLLGEPEAVELYCGLFPLSSTSFQRIVVRRGRVPQLDSKDFRMMGYTDRYYYEVCSSKPVLDYVAKQVGA